MKKLLQTFDFQQFQQNPRLAKIISDVESRYANVLSDDDLELVNAAGDAAPLPIRMPDRASRAKKYLDEEDQP